MVLFVNNIIEENRNCHKKMVLSCCRNTFRTLEAFKEHKTIHAKGLHIFECPQCGFTSPTLPQMVAHKIIHNKEKIAVLEEENKLVDKPWFVPKEKIKDKGEIQLLADNLENDLEIQENPKQDYNSSEPSNLDLDSNGDEDLINVSSSDSEPHYSDIDDPKVIFNDADIANKDYPENDSSEIKELNLTCIICDTVFQEKSLFEDHVEIHASTTKIQPNISSSLVIFMFKCEKCEFKCENIEEFDTHKKIHYENVAYICKKCCRNFKTKSQLQRHDNKMHSKPYLCEICPFHSKYHHSLIRHIRRIHNLNNDLNSTKSSYLNVNHQSNSTDHDIIQSKQNLLDKKFKCLTCGKRFSKKSHLQYHTVIHSNEKPFHCLLCEYKSKWERNLTVHMKIHKNEHKLRNIKNIINLVERDDSKHQETHSEKHFKCLTCGKTFPKKLRLENHMVVHSNEKPFHCLLCDYKSKWDKNLNAHMKTHKNKHKLRVKEKIVNTIKSDESKQQETYVCNFCDYQTKSQSSFKLHVDDFCLKLFNNLKFCNAGDEKYVTDDVSKNSNNNTPSFRCNVCNHICMSCSELTEHMEKHEILKRDSNEHTLWQEERDINNLIQKDLKYQKIYVCNFCDYQTKSVSTLQIHVEDNHPINKHKPNIRPKQFFNCNTCKYKSKLAGDLRKHYFKYHKDEYSETNKQMNFEKNVDLKEKERNNDNGKDEYSKNKLLGYKQSQNNTYVKFHSCQFCSYKSIYKSSLRKHLSSYHSSEVNESRKYISSNNIKKVIPHNEKKLHFSKFGSNKKFTSKKKFGCSFCEYTSKWCIGDIYRHMKRIHSKVGTVIIKNEAENTNIVKKPSKTFVDKSFEYFNQFGCSYCNFISKRSSNDVHEHMINIHRKTGDIIIRKIMKKIVKPSKNTICTKNKEKLSYISNDSNRENKSKSKSNLIHKKVHKCNECSYTSYEKKYLVKHLAYHTQGSGPVLYYKCPECLQCYKMKKRLISHLKSHIGTPFNRPRICPGCNKTFNSERRQTFSHIEKCLS